MSKISTIHDGIVSLIQTELPTYAQLPNPYALELNNELYLTKGFGVAVAAAQRTDRTLSCQFSWEREFQIVLTNQVTATDHDITARQTITKAMLEDHYALAHEIEKTALLSGVAVNFRIVSDSGLQFLELGERGRYFILVISTLAEYFEDFTT